MWVASGQSNMEWPLDRVQNAQAEIAAANYRGSGSSRSRRRSPTTRSTKRKPSTWVECKPETAARFSAVAYFFGRQLTEKLGVPIGLISTNWGGTPADAWTSLSALSADAVADAGILASGPG